MPYWTQETKNWRNKSRHLPQKWRHLPLVTRRSHPNNNVVQTPTTSIQATTKGGTSTPTTSGPNGTNQTATMIVNVKDPRDTETGDLVTDHTPEEDTHRQEDDHPPDMTTDRGDALQKDNHRDTTDNIVHRQDTKDSNNHRREVVGIGDVLLNDALTLERMKEEDTLEKTKDTIQKTMEVGGL